ncbi:MAG TPA: hypothetical protein VK498_09030, partial [Ferruginibacter sp.]|nr:hypothetical protein [Ferruginibacter sp.]
MLEKLESLKKSFGVEEQSRLKKLLVQLSRHHFNDAASLIQLHESLVFMLAYPRNKIILAQVKKILHSYPGRIEYLRKANADLSPFDAPEISGIAGTSVTIMAGYKFAQWLSKRHTKDAEIDWDGYEEDAAIGATLPRILPLLEEEGLVEAHLSFREYIHAAKPKGQSDLAWLVKNFTEPGMSEKRIGELFEFLKLFIRFTPSFKFSRTGLR